MEFQEVMTARHSVRKYTDQALTVEIVSQIVELTRSCPSWANLQPVRYHCVLNRQLKSRLAQTSDYNQRYMDRAAAVMVVSAVLNLSGADAAGTLYYHTSKEWTMFDAGIASYGLCLAAQDLGVGTVILGDFDGSGVKTIIDLPENEDVMALIAMGYPEKPPRGPERHDLKELLSIIE